MGYLCIGVFTGCTVAPLHHLGRFLHRVPPGNPPPAPPEIMSRTKKETWREPSFKRVPNVSNIHSNGTVDRSFPENDRRRRETERFNDRSIFNPSHEILLHPKRFWKYFQEEEIFQDTIDGGLDRISFSFWTKFRLSIR